MTSHPSPGPAQGPPLSAARIREMFSEIAPRYDFGNHMLSLHVDSLWRRRAARLLAPAPGERVLDLCCGTGDLALACAREGKDQTSVIGCDFARPMLTLAREKTRRAGLERVDYATADGLRLPFDDGTFDAVTIAFGLRNLVDWSGGLREMARVVRPGGRILILEFTIPPNRAFRALFFFYFRRLLPWLARMGTGSPDYGYLPASVTAFPTVEPLGKMMEAAGWTQVRWELPTFGIVAIHQGVKPT